MMMMASSLISYVDRYALAVLAPMILADTGMTGEQYGFAISCFSIAYMLGNPVWGFLLDRGGLRICMTIAVLSWSIASFAHASIGAIGWLSIPVQFAIARFMLGAGEGATFPGALRAAVLTLPKEQQGRGISLGYSGGSLGAIVTPFIVTPIAIAFGWRGAFLVTTAIGLLWVSGWLAVSSRYGALKTAQQRVPGSSLRRLWGPTLWGFLALYSFGALPLAVGTYAAPLFLSKAFGLSQASLGRWLWIPPLGWELGYLFWGWMTDRGKTSFPRMVFVLSVGSGVLALVPLAGSAAGALALFFISMFLTGGFIIVALRYGLRCYPSDQGLLAGLGPGVWSFFVAVLMPYVGALFDAGSYLTLFGVVACMPAAGSVAWAILLRFDDTGRKAMSS